MKKNKEDFTSNIRLKIIKPFLLGEKKLKELEVEYGVSYATLKRWVKSYKEKGTEGLNRKENKNKLSYKKLNEKALNFIKEFYLSKKNLTVSELYQDACEKLTAMDCNISYSTFYRVINNLDNFVQETSLNYISKKNNRAPILLVREFYLDSLFWDVGSKRLRPPLITLVLESENLNILSFSATFNRDDPGVLFATIRDGIIRNSGEYEILIPEAIFIISPMRNNILTKKSLQEIPIHFSQEDFKIDEIEKFITLLAEDVKTLSLRGPLNNLCQSLTSYLFLPELHRGKKNIEILDPLLCESKRQLYRGNLRFKNKIHIIPSLKKVIEKNIMIRYNPLDDNEIYLFYKDERIALK